LLTFRRFDLLPETIRHQYLAGHLHLLPYPGSLAFWGVQDCMKLQSQLPMAMQIPLLQGVDRHQAATTGLKVPQAVSSMMPERRTIIITAKVKKPSSALTAGREFYATRTNYQC